MLFSHQPNPFVKWEQSRPSLCVFVVCVNGLYSKPFICWSKSKWRNKAWPAHGFILSDHFAMESLFSPLQRAPCHCDAKQSRKGSHWKVMACQYYCVCCMCGIWRCKKSPLTAMAWHGYGERLNKLTVCESNFDSTIPFNHTGDERISSEILYYTKES